MAKIFTKDNANVTIGGQVVRVTPGTGAGEGKVTNVTIVSEEYDRDAKKRKKVYRDVSIWNNEYSTAGEQLAILNPAPGAYIMVYAKPSDEDGEGNPKFSGYKFQAYAGKIAVQPKEGKHYTALMGRVISAKEGTTAKGAKKLTVTISGGKDKIYVLTISDTKFATDAVDKAMKGLINNKAAKMVQGDDGKYRPENTAPIIMVRASEEGTPIGDEGTCEGYYVSKWDILGYATKREDANTQESGADDGFEPADGDIPYFNDGEDLAFMNA